MNEMLPEFLSESDEHLQTLNNKMLDLEASIKNNTEMSTDDLNTMFRGAHTIKGTASFIGLTKTVRLTHKAETLLQKLRDKEMKLSGNIVDALFSAFDTLTSLLNTLREQSNEDSVDIDKDVNQIEAILTNQVVAKPEAVKGEKNPVPPIQPVVSPKPQKKRGPILEKYLEQFIGEAEQNVQDIEQMLLKSEQEKGNVEIVNNIFRSMHTIKGSSGIVNAVDIAEVAHKMENILAFFREKKRPLSLDVISLLLKGIDVVKSLLDSLKKLRKIPDETDTTGICNELGDMLLKVSNSTPAPKPVEAKASVPETKTNTAQAEKPDLGKFVIGPFLTAVQKEEFQAQVDSGKDAYAIILCLDEKVPLKSMKFAIVEERLKKNGKVIAVFPPIESFDSASGRLNFAVNFCSDINEKDIRNILSLDGLSVLGIESLVVEKSAKVTEGANVEIKKEPEVKLQPPVQPMVEAKKGVDMDTIVKDDKKMPVQGQVQTKAVPIEISTIKIDSRKLDTLMNLSGELVIIRAQYARLANLFNSDLLAQKEITRMSEHITAQLDALTKEIESMLVESGTHADKGAIRLKKIASEIQGALSGLNQKLDKADIVENIHMLDETTSTLEKVSSDIQAGVMQTRMVPVEGVFTRFKRIVRDISKEINKEVELDIVGAETELDKKIVDSLADPLTHMIRNAVDHGIEDKETREKIGKPPIGRVFLKASHKGNSICIEVGDDGKGMDPDKLGALAIKKGILTQDQIDKMSEKDKLSIVFLPGFSTAEKVTGLSGRGVGMDVVKNMITSVNGIVDIETVIGQGTTFTMRIPLTLAIIQALLVSIGEEIYAFPLESVTEIIKIRREDVYSVDGNSTVKLRDHALSLVDLEKVIKVKNPNRKDELNRKIVIINDGETQLGVSVDALVGKDEIVIKPFTEHFSNVKGITGASILADGRVALILDPIIIIRESR